MTRGGVAILCVFVATMTVTAAGEPPKLDVAERYRTICQPCHGPDGNSPFPGMSFSDTEWKHGTRTQDMVKIITEGVPGTPMLPFKDILSKAEIAALARLVRSFDKTLKPEPPLPRKSGTPGAQFLPGETRLQPRPAHASRSY